MSFTYNVPKVVQSFVPQSVFSAPKAVANPTQYSSPIGPVQPRSTFYTPATQSFPPVSQQLYSGPVQQGVNQSIFALTGKSVPTSTPVTSTAKTPRVAGTQTGSVSNGNTSGGSSTGNSQPSGPTQEQIDSKRAAEERAALEANVNTQYNQGIGFLDQLQNQLQGQEQSYYDAASQPYTAQLPLLQQAHDAALQRDQLGVQTAQQGQEDALSQARRMYHELSQGNQQRYGGTSSAGEFAQALQGRQLQQNQSQAIQATQQNLAKLYQHSTEVESQYQSQLQSIEQGKQAAILQAKQDFQNKINDLNSKRMQLGQNKQQLELDILREFYNNRQAIEQQANQIKQNLDAIATQSRLSLQNAFEQYQANAGKPIDLTQIPQAQYDAINQQVYGYAPQIQGNIKKRFDQPIA